MPDFVFELGVEEVPVSDIRSIEEQLREKFQQRLAERRVKLGGIETTATNKRFMVHISGMAARAEDVEEEVVGPSREIAYDEKDNPTLALNKFMTAHNVQKADLKEVETKKGLYIAIQKKTAGESTAVLLEDIIPQVLGELNFSKAMVWNESRVPFIRPIKNILALFNHERIPFVYAGIESSNTIHGHHLLSDDMIEINSFKDYIEQLNKNFVLVKEDERKEKILAEIKDIEEDLDAVVRLDEEILEYYVYNNEYPVVFTGTFDKKYLDLPHEIISTFMIQEKKLQPITDKKSKLMNAFLGVSNIPDENQHVARGNERVIQATFEDAKFFWDSDRHIDFRALRDSLKNILFQRDLGTYFEKTERLVRTVEFLSQETGHTKLFPDLKEAALFCKNDLVTQMVREFPSLQGIMGGLYLKESGAKQDVWKTVYGHYLPRGFSSEICEHRGAGLLSLADKVDNLACFMSKGIKTTGSKDPYGIRRDANAIVKLIIDLELDFDLGNLIRFTAELLGSPAVKSSSGDRVSGLEIQLREFLRGRIESIFKDFLNLRGDLTAAIAEKDIFNVHKMYLRGQAVSTMMGTESSQHLIILHKRLKNILKELPPYRLSEDLLQETEEKILFEIFKESKAKIEELILADQYIEACSDISEMKPVIDRFFDHVLIMAKDERVKENRVALLQHIDELLSKVANFSLLKE